MYFAAQGPSAQVNKEADRIECHPYSAVGLMNLNAMLVENIRSHDYFKGLAEFKTFEEVVDQIYYDVRYVTPWIPGTHRCWGPAQGQHTQPCVCVCVCVRADLISVNTLCE